LGSASVSPLSTTPIKTSVPALYHVSFALRRNKGSLFAHDDALLAKHDRNVFLLDILQHHAKYETTLF